MIIRLLPSSTLFPYTTALPICTEEWAARCGSRDGVCARSVRRARGGACRWHRASGCEAGESLPREDEGRDRKSTRLNSSHVEISYAVFCLKKQKDLLR